MPKTKNNIPVGHTEVGNNVYHRHFESCNALTKHLQSLDPAKAWPKDGVFIRAIKGEEIKDEAFYFGKSRSSTQALSDTLNGRASKLARKTFEEARQEMRKWIVDKGMDRSATPVFGARNRRNVRGGGRVHVDRFIAGLDDCFVRRKRTKMQPVIRLGVGVCVSAGVDEKEFARTFGFACATAEHLERCGFATEIEAYALNEGTNSCYWQNGETGQNHLQTITVKSHKRPLDVQALLSAGSPVLLRTLLFSLWCDNTEGTGMDASSGLGSVSKDIERAMPGHYDMIMPTRSGVDFIAKGLTKLLTDKAA